MTKAEKAKRAMLDERLRQMKEAGVVLPSTGTGESKPFRITKHKKKVGT